MGSPLLPIPGSASYGNPTGVGNNPVFNAENQNKLMQLVPGAQPTAQLGQQGKNPMLPQANAAPVAPVYGAPQMPGVITPAANPTGGVQTVKPVGTPAPGSFGYTALPGQVQIPKLTLDPKMTETWDKQFGKGTGESLANLLGNMPGASQQATQAFLQQMQPYFQENMNDLMEQYGMLGQRFGSTSALAAGKATADFSASQSSLMAQMMQWAFGSYLSALSGFKTQNQQGNIYGTIGNILGLAGSAGKALSAGGVDNSVVDILAGL